MKRALGIKSLRIRSVGLNLLLIAVGSAVTAVGINAFLVPHRFLSSGVSGLSQLLSYMTPVSLAVYIILLNIPIFIFGWRYVGRVFVIGSVVGLLTLSAALYATEWMAGMGWAPERLLSAIIGGALSGGGTGLVFRANSSHGGIDILAAAIKRRWSLSIGTVGFAFNAVIVVALAFVFGLHAGLYTIVSQFVGSVAIDKFMVGFDTGRAVFIITSEPEKIADMIIKKLNRGVTYLEGQGAYLGRRERVIYCVVSRSQLAQVKHYVQLNDPEAFLSIAEVSEVQGHGFRAVPI